MGAIGRAGDLDCHGETAKRLATISPCPASVVSSFALRSA